MKTQNGFTLVELMITAAIVAILAAIAIPSYTTYVKRGQLSEGPNDLAALQVQMESYYQNLQSYDNNGVCGVAAPTATNFTFSCVESSGGQGYTYTATGIGPVAGTNYTVDQQGDKATTGSSTKSCWIVTGNEC